VLLNCALLDAGALSLKGKSGRTRVFAVLGDEQLARSAEFAELQSVHAQLVEAWRTRAKNHRKLINAARLKAEGMGPGLQEFYRRISHRKDHYAGEPATKDVAEPAR
jgi:adenylate cyclase